MTDNGLYITIKNGTVFIMDSDDEIVYRINQHELPLKRDGNKSEWIMQLMDKLWIDVATLYRLAQTIKQEYPENTIDWRETFFIVEKAKYLDTLGEVMTTQHESVVKSLFERVEFGQKETTEETHKIIEKILDQRLKEFSL